jgi:hypothetical protein
LKKDKAEGAVDSVVKGVVDIVVEGMQATRRKKFTSKKVFHV